MSMIILDRASRVKLVSLSSNTKDTQDSIFSQALENARQQEAQFDKKRDKSAGTSLAVPNPYLKAANDLETAGQIFLVCSDYGDHMAC